MTEWVPSDDWLASWVRALRGLRPDADVRHLLPALREEVAAEIEERREKRRRDEEEAAEEAAAAAAKVRRRRKVAEAEAVQPPRRRRRGSGSPGSAAVLDMLSSPEGLAFLNLCAAMPAMMEGVGRAFAALAEDRAREAGGPFSLSPRRRALPVRRYLARKLGQPVPSPASGPVPLPPAVERAACNAVTVRAARAWADRLAAGSDAETVAVLAELREIGGLATVAAAPLRLWDPEGGAPRGLWPDPPPPEEGPAVSEGIKSGAKPAFVAGGSHGMA